MGGVPAGSRLEGGVHNLHPPCALEEAGHNLRPPCFRTVEDAGHNPHPLYHQVEVQLGVAPAAEDVAPAAGDGPRAGPGRRRKGRREAGSVLSWPWFWGVNADVLDHLRGLYRVVEVGHLAQVFLSTHHEVGL